MFKFLKRLFFHAWHPSEPAHKWKAIRMGGGGISTSPYEMREWEAILWVGTQIGGEVMYVDREVGFIIYRAKS